MMSSNDADFQFSVCALALEETYLGTRNMRRLNEATVEKTPVTPRAISPFFLRSSKGIASGLGAIMWCGEYCRVSTTTSSSSSKDDADPKPVKNKAETGGIVLVLIKRG